MNILETFKGIMRAMLFAGLVLVIYSATSNTDGMELISGVMIGAGAIFGWYNPKESD